VLAHGQPAARRALNSWFLYLKRRKNKRNRKLAMQSAAEALERAHRAQVARLCMGVLAKNSAVKARDQQVTQAIQHNRDRFAKR
jgi:hypothetical protein